MKFSILWQSQNDHLDYFGLILAVAAGLLVERLAVATVYQLNFAIRKIFRPNHGKGNSGAPHRHAIIRDAWEQSGASIRLCDVNKSNGNGSRLLLCRLIPAMIQKQSAHRKNGSGFRSIDLNLAAACARARQRYRRIRDQKKKQF